MLGDLGSHRETRWDDALADAICRRRMSSAWRAGRIACRVPGRLAPGLADDAFEHDGQLTKRDVRASALARLGRVPGRAALGRRRRRRLGRHRVAARAHPGCRAVAVERRPTRAKRIRPNAARLGVPGLDSASTGDAPAYLTGCPTPDAVFVGGGATARGVWTSAGPACAPGGRLVVHAVTAGDREVLVDAWHAAAAAS